MRRHLGYYHCGHGTRGAKLDGQTRETQMRVMRNLRELIQGHPHALVEIQRMGFETLNKLLQTSGQSLSFGWGIIFEMIQSSIGTPPSPWDLFLSGCRTKHHL